MSVTITLNDNLVAQLQAQAEARHLSVEALALHIIEEAVTNGDNVAWRACNQRRIELIRKQFAQGFPPDEAGEGPVPRITPLQREGRRVCMAADRAAQYRLSVPRGL